MTDDSTQTGGTVEHIVTAEPIVKMDGGTIGYSFKGPLRCPIYPPIDWSDSHSLWWACSEPERPPDALTAWHDGCETCLKKARVQLRRYPSDAAVVRVVAHLERKLPRSRSGRGVAFAGTGSSPAVGTGSVAFAGTGSSPAVGTWQRRQRRASAGPRMTLRCQKAMLGTAHTGRGYPDDLTQAVEKSLGVEITRDEQGNVTDVRPQSGRADG